MVDAANLLTPDRRAALEAKLKAHEDKTTDQVVVATVPSLEGTSVEDYGNRLYRAWALGTKAKNNGALLLVAPNERKVRIEVGYGLEGALTDALSGVIIRTAIAPRFRNGDFSGGIEAGVDAILSVAAGDAEEWGRRAKVRSDEVSSVDLIAVIFVALVVLILVWSFWRAMRSSPRAYRTRRGTWITTGPGSGWSGGWSGGGGSSFGGGFSGGGGSSGGGGASGSW